jgi:hypothetical protein
MALFQVVPQCSLTEVYQRLRDPCCLHHQGPHLSFDEGRNLVLAQLLVTSSNLRYILYRIKWKDIVGIIIRVKYLSAGYFYYPTLNK